MISITKSADESGRLLKLFQELLDSLPERTATLESKRTQKDDGTIIRLTPTNPRAAQFGAHTEDGVPSLIDVFFGSGTTFELNGDVDELLERVRRLALSVISGRCEERFGFLGVRGQIRLDGEPGYRCTDYFHPRLYPKTVRYEPYDHETTKP
ncbi:MAG: hypothetical protein WCC78_15275 [Terriglobales bacterium]